MKLLKDIYYTQAKNILLTIQIKNTAIFIGKSLIFNVRIELFTFFHKLRISYHFSSFWLGYYLCDLINKLIPVTPKFMLKFWLISYDLAKKIRDKK